MDRRHPLTHFVLPLLLILLAFGGCAAIQGQAGPLTGSGTLEGRQVAVASELGGPVAALLADEGAPVRAGDVLVRLDDATARTQVAQAHAAVAAAQANHARLLSLPRPEEVDAAEAALEMAQAEAQSAGTALLHAREAISNPVTLDLEIGQARTAVRLAEQAVEGAEADMEAERFRYHVYVDLKENVSDDTRRMWDLRVQAAELAVKRAEAELGAARADLNALHEMRAVPLEATAQLNAAAAAYTATLAGVEVAQARLDAVRSGTRPEELTIAEAQLLQARAALTMALTQQEMLTLTAPISGVVVARSFHEGEVAPPGLPILTLVDPSEVFLTIYVPEERVREVRVGQAATVRVDAYPDEAFTGYVDRIAGQAEYTPRAVEVSGERTGRVFAVRIRIPNPDGRLLPGLPAVGALSP